MTKTTKQPWPLWFLFIAGAAVILLQATCADFAIAQGVPRGTVTTQMMESYPIRGFSSVDCSAEACNATGDLGQQCTDPAGLWLCDGAGAFVLLVTGGSGDVVGPASSIDNAIARYNGTTGKLLQGYTSGAPVISDTGLVDLVNAIRIIMANDQSAIRMTASNAGSSPYLIWENSSNVGTIGQVNASGDVQFLEDTSPFGIGLLVNIQTGDAVLDTMDVHAPNGDVVLDSAGTLYRFGWAAAATGDGYDLDLQEMQATVEGTVATRTRPDQWIPPPCPADLNDVSLGGVCTEAATGKIRYRGTLEAIP